MIKINDSNFSAEIEKSDKPCVIDLYADWCMPCKMLAPVLEELEAEYPNVKFCKVNVDESPAVARAFGVSSIPMVALVKDGTFLDASVGFVPKASLASLIEKTFK